MRGTFKLFDEGLLLVNCFSRMPRVCVILFYFFLGGRVQGEGGSASLKRTWIPLLYLFHKSDSVKMMVACYFLKSTVPYLVN